MDCILGSKSHILPTGMKMSENREKCEMSCEMTLILSFSLGLNITLEICVSSGSSDG